MSSKGTINGIGILGVSLIIAAIAGSIFHQSQHIDTHTVLKLKSVTQLPPSNIIHHSIIQPHYHSGKTVTVKPGDTLASIFENLKLSAAILEQATASPISHDILTKIKPGQQLTFHIHDKKLQQLIFPFNHVSTLYLNATTAGFSANIESKPVTIVPEYKGAIIQTTLDDAMIRAGIPLRLYHQMTELFQGSINFKHDIKRGDRFGILFQEYYIDGKKDHPGNILVAEFKNKDKTVQAIRYTYPKNHTGYYTAKGYGVEPLFLSRPIKHYKRISSHFTYHRLDPYLHVMRPHLGIDYAAPRGTPICSIGNGRVIFKGRNHGYGNAVVIRYSKKYKTLYGHMQKFAKGLHIGDLVKRGQLIGYVGSTGWSTGPHLHFEMYVYGIPQDPLKLKFPGGKPIPSAYTQRYLSYAHKMLDQFNLYQASRLAQNDKTTFKE